MTEIKERHSRNIPAVSPEEMERIYSAKVLVVGCGGLGGNIIENLCRIGIGHIRMVDGDTFAESNLNRQLLSNNNNIGMSKALAAAERVRSIDPDITAEPVTDFLTAENAESLLSDVDIVMDALDSVDARLILEEVAARAGKVIVHGAISGWDLQVMLVPPGSGLLHELYYKAPAKKISPSLPMTPAACAALQTAAAIRYLIKGKSVLDKVLLAGSLSDMSFDLIQFGD